MRFYISRIAVRGNNTFYGVVNEDSGAEDFLSIQQLNNLFNTDHDVLGVERLLGYLSVTPYQHPDFVKPAQTKLEMMCGVKVTTYKDFITRISVPGLQLDKPTKVKLSDYGGVCEDNFLIDLNIQGSNTLELAFDDKVKVSSRSLQLSAAAGTGLLKINVRDVTDRCSILQIYRGLWAGNMIPLQFLLIDHAERFNELKKTLER